jgi:protein-tyrosine phosphatase
MLAVRNKKRRILMHILVVCFANLCRSVMAETLIRHYADQMDQPIFVASAGLQAQRGQPADPMTVRLLQRRGYTPRVSHRSRTVQELMHIELDCVLVMDEEQRQAVLARYPALGRRVMLLGRDAGPAIEDPYRQGWLACQQTLNQIEPFAQYWVERFMQQHSLAS